MSAKKLLNDPSRAVDEMVEGIVLTNPHLQRLSGYNVIVRNDFQELKAANKVALISGGGSGHEPAHAGYVGKGMLTAAVAGHVFASPAVESIVAAIRTVTGPAGCVLIVKNYTGDRLNFGLAAEAAKAEGLSVEVVFVADDCALEPNKGITGRRGLAGTCFVHKIAGATAESGATLAEVTAAARNAAAKVGTMGVAFTVCSVPGKPLSDRLSSTDGMMELGLGIHGEPGAQKLAVEPSKQIVEKLIQPIVGPRGDDGFCYLPVSAGSPVAVLVNNLGGTSALEVFIAARDAYVVLTSAPYNLAVSRIYAAPMMTSLEMAGISLTIFDLTNDEQAMLEKLDLATSAPGWPQVFSASSLEEIPAPEAVAAVAGVGDDLVNDPSDPVQQSVQAAITAATDALIRNEPELTEWDTKVGDGDCGETFKEASLAIQSLIAEGQLQLTSSKKLMQSVAESVSKMGGTSGAILTIFFRACEATFNDLEAGTALTLDKTTRGQWAKALTAGVHAISYYGGAKPGMRTMLDTFAVFDKAVQDGLAVPGILQATMAGALETANMQASAGRSNYVPEEQLNGVPDPGAMAVAYAIEALLKTMTKE